ncbi:MAG: hypothetical protein WBG73_01740 [Coleofasciculaceae cyanobacterium]
MTANYFAGENAEKQLTLPIPESPRSEAQEARDKMLHRLSFLCDQMMSLLLEGEDIPKLMIWQTIMLVEVETPNDFVGREQGDLSSCRGLILGFQTWEG